MGRNQIVSLLSFVTRDTNRARHCGATVAERWRDSGVTVARRWRDSGATVAWRWRDGGATVARRRGAALDTQSETLHYTLSGHGLAWLHHYLICFITFNACTSYYWLRPNTIPGSSQLSLIAISTGPIDRMLHEVRVALSGLDH